MKIFKDHRSYEKYFKSIIPVVLRADQNEDAQDIIDEIYDALDASKINSIRKYASHIENTVCVVDPLDRKVKGATR
eukprot:UN09203